MFLKRAAQSRIVWSPPDFTTSLLLAQWQLTDILKPQPPCRCSLLLHDGKMVATISSLVVYYFSAQQSQPSFCVSIYFTARLLSLFSCNDNNAIIILAGEDNWPATAAIKWFIALGDVAAAVMMHPALFAAGIVAKAAREEIASKIQNQASSFMLSLLISIARHRRDHGVAPASIPFLWGFRRSPVMVLATTSLSRRYQAL